MSNFNILLLELAHNELHVSFQWDYLSQSREHVHHSKRIHADIP